MSARSPEDTPEHLDESIRLRVELAQSSVVVVISVHEHEDDAALLDLFNEWQIEALRVLAWPQDPKVANLNEHLATVNLGGADSGLHVSDIAVPVAADEHALWCEFADGSHLSIMPGPSDSQVRLGDHPQGM